MKTPNLMKDGNGKDSAKRIMGFTLIIVATIFLLVIGVVSIFEAIADPGTALDVGKTIFGGGCILIGLTLGEFFKRVSK